MIKLVQKHLTPDLLKVKPRNTHPHAGHCYVASEALYHIIGPRKVKPMCGRYSGGTHWWLVEITTGRIIDPTSGQFTTPPYRNGRGCGFLTKKPSKRTQKLLERINGKY